MGEMRQEWTWRDIFRSVGLAFSFSRLLIGFLGLAFLAVVDGLLTWAIEDAAWAYEGATGLGSWVPELLLVVRCIAATYVFLFTATAIAYSAKGELLEGEGAGVKESIGFVFKKFGAIFWTPVLFWIFIAMMALFAFIPFILPALIARLAGWTLLVSLVWYTLGFFFIMMFAVLAALGVLAFLFSVFLAPPIIATRQEGALDATLDSIDLMRGKGAFWVAILVFLASVFVGVCVLGKTFDVTYRVSNIMVGEDFRKTVVAMPEEIKPRRGTQLALASLYWPGEFRGNFVILANRLGLVFGAPRGRLERDIMATRAEIGRGGGLPTRYRVAGWILGIWVLILAGFAVSFTMGAFVAAGTLTYLIVREEDEFLEPTTVEVPPPAAKPAEKEAEEEKKDKKEEKEEKEEKAEKKTAKSKKSSKRKKE